MDEPKKRMFCEPEPWPRAEALRDEIEKRCYVSEILKVMNELELHIQTMGIAYRFNRTRFVGELYAIDQTDPDLGILDIVAGGKLNEAGFKRAELLNRINALRRELMIMISKIADLRIEVEVVNMNDDGTLVPAPDPDSIKVDDLLQPKM